MMTEPRDLTAGANDHGTPAIRITRVTSHRPILLTKQFRLDDGQLEKIGGGILVQGEAVIETVDDLNGLARVLKGLQPNQALVYGLPDRSPIALTTKSLWKAAGEPTDSQPRTAEMFSWNAGPGIMMLDYDPEPGAEVLERDALVEAIRSAIPGLRDVAMLWWPSASSHIVNADSGQDLTGLKGQRLYIVVKDARDIPRAGKALVDALWLAGHGSVRVSKSGSLLERTLVDSTVWQTNRLDFAAGAFCKPPLHQDRGEPQLISGTQQIADSATIFPDLPTDKQKAVAGFRAAARLAKKPESERVKTAWCDALIKEITGSEAGGERTDDAKRIAVRALENRTLSGAYRIVICDTDGERSVTVDQILDNPQAYHGLHTLDPIEPDYDGRRRVGMLFLEQPRPVLFSFAHGGQSYRLSRDLIDIEIVQGKLRDAVDATLEVLKGMPDMFNFGSALVNIGNSSAQPLDEAQLSYYLGGKVQYWRWKQLKGGRVRVPENPPKELVKQVLSLGDRRPMKKLDALISAPTLRLDGTLLSRPGYDAETRLFLQMPDAPLPAVDLTPSKEQVIKALRTLQKPFEKFPFRGNVDRGVFLAALLTAVLRSVLPTAPAFGFDAPVQGSGKTLLANCIGVLATGTLPGVYPPTSPRDDEETRKRLFSAIKDGARVIVWDNLVGTFDSPSMAAALSADSLRDRILGRSEIASIPNRALLVLTGNNLTLTGDMARRVLVSRIDPQTEQPFAREFEVDPLEYVRQNRQELVAAALTILLGGIAGKTSHAPGRMASFEKWDDLVRQTVCWVNREICPGQFGDPMSAVIAAQGADPAQESLSLLLTAWSEAFGEKWMSSADVVAITRSFLYHPGGRGPEARLSECIRDINECAIRSATSLGRVLGYRVDRLAAGRRLEARTDPHSKTKQWRVCEVTGPQV